MPKMGAADRFFSTDFCAMPAASCARFSQMTPAPVNSSDADWSNAAFIARLPELRTLRIGTVQYDLAQMREQGN